MGKVTFTYRETANGYIWGYKCSEPGDQSGEYVRAEVAEEFLAVLKEVVTWNARYPSSRIFSKTEIRRIAKEMDAINEKAIAAIAKIETENANDDSDICGLCGQPGADKIPHQEHWPGERIPDSEFVHAECEDEECKRAHACLTPKQRQAVLDGIAGR